MLKRFLIGLILLIPTVLMSQSMSKHELAKLDPRFYAVIAGESPVLRKAAMPLPALSIGVNEDGTQIYGAIIYTTDPDALRSEGIQVNSELPGFVTSRVTSSELIRLSRLDQVDYVDSGEILHPLNDVATGCIGADLLHAGYVNNTPFKGTGVIVCIIDSGIDWTHLDFRDPVTNTSSRILSIWDQTLTATGGESTPAETGCNYGVEYTKAHIEDEIDGSPANFVREQDTNGHGTHVTGTAAGNGAALSTQKFAGIAPEADIIVVKSGDDSFPTPNIIDGLSYIRQKAAALGKAVVINMSLGSNEGPNDGTTSKATAIDAFTNSGPGRAVVVSAGNSGDDNIHLQGTIPNGNSTQITFDVPDYTPESDAGNNDLAFDVWFDGNGGISANVTSPNGFTNTQDPNGTSTSNTDDGSISITNRVYSGNNDRYIKGYVFDGDETKTPVQGTWTLNLTNNSGSMMNYHCILHDAVIGDPNMNVTLTGGDSQYTLSNSADGAIIVGSYTHRYRWADNSDSTWWGGAPDRSDGISPYSSYGPTRDNRQKPDISAPGQKIASSKSKDKVVNSRLLMPGQKHFVNQGTSMASPVVVGAVALLLQQNPGLTAGSIRNLITQNADTDGYTGAVWNDRWGWGRVNIFKAMVKSLYPPSTAGQEILIYDTWESSAVINTEDKMIALRISPSINGEVTGLFFHPYIDLALSGPLKVEVWTDNDGLPSTKIGNTINFDHRKVLSFSWNFINLNGIDATVTSGTDYHVLLYPTQGDVFTMFLDVGTIDGRTRISSNQGQTFIQQPNFDVRMRPVISTARNKLTRIHEADGTSFPSRFELSQNYPNPFNPNTEFQYWLPKNSEISIRIYNVLGRVVRNLLNTNQQAGYYTASWDGLDDHGRMVSSGIYFIHIETVNIKKVRKITLMR